MEQDFPATPEWEFPASDRPASGPGVEEAAVSRWQEFAEAVWLAAYLNRHGRPGAERGTAQDDGITRAHRRSVLSGEGTHAHRPDTRPALAAAPPEAHLADAADPMDGQSPLRDVRVRSVGTVDVSGPSSATASTAWPLPDSEGTSTLRISRPLLPAEQSPQPGPGRRTALLARALRPLARRAPSRDTLTTEQGAADGMWMPFLRPARTSAFDPVLLIDGSLAMRIWEETVARLAESAEHSGAFRSVRTVWVNVPRFGTATLRWSNEGAPTEPAEPVVGRGSRVFLVVTDGLAPGWAAPAADGLLSRLAHAGPTALLHLLPPQLWFHSSLHPCPAFLEASGFGAPNDGLAHWTPPDGPDPMRPLPEAGDGSVPVLSLKPGSVAAWTALITGERGVRRALPVVLVGMLTKGAPAPGLRAPRFPRAAAAAVRRFFISATPAARRLAIQLATIRFDFDLVEQRRRRLMPATGSDHLAEILMGGLIDGDSAGGSRHEFADGVREALLATTARPQLVCTVSVGEELLAAGASRVALHAGLREPIGTTLPGPAERVWVRSELAVMRALSGPYPERAKRIELNLCRIGPGTAERAGAAPRHMHPQR